MSSTQSLDQQLLVPPEWEVDWDDLVISEITPPARTPWYADWDERD